MRELVTVQVGSFANYIGSHFWNFQDELFGLGEDQNADSEVFRNTGLNMDVLYRAGEAHQGNPTYTPRLVSIGAQGSLGTLCSTGSLYDHVPLSDTSVEWQGSSSPVDAITNDDKRQVLGKDIVDCLENDVHFWTDFSKGHYHPRSLCELNSSWSDIHDFDNYEIAQQITSFQGEDMVDKLRFFTEECDHIQGFRFIVDDSGWVSSVAADFMEIIADNFGKIPILLYSAKDPVSYTNATNKKQIVSRSLHEAISFSRLSLSCKLIVPLGLPSLNTSKFSTFLNINDTKPFHSSAVYAASIYSLSLPFRMEQAGSNLYSDSIYGAVDIHEIIQILTEQSRQKHGSHYGCSNTNTTINGRASISEMKDAFHEGYRNDIFHPQPKPMFSHLSAAACPLPFLYLFHHCRHGELLSPINSSQDCLPKGPIEIVSIPMSARLRYSNAILPLIEKRLENLRRFGGQRGAVGAQLLMNWGFDKDEVEDMGEVLSKMVLSLDPYPEMSTDSD
ncbi:Misato-like protein [Zostera marina]|uniref:Misato-like protein n=1 Tax=Zostera marina TaxID=29655 RepID=A0A0K9NK64_ZOSMR|nr:Misato-like protein [Zostera marina]